MKVTYVDFNIYIGGSSSQESSGNRLAYDVVVKLTTPFVRQGYQLFYDNFYTSPKLFSDLLDQGIPAAQLRASQKAVRT